MQTLDEYREEIIRNMRSVGTYKDSFANTVDAYARAMMDYDTKTLSPVLPGSCHSTSRWRTENRIPAEQRE